MVVIKPIIINATWTYITNKTEYVVHKLNFGSHCQLVQIIKQSDEVTKARVHVINWINVKPESENGLGFLK